jgi:hypothetical protein
MNSVSTIDVPYIQKANCVSQDQVKNSSPDIRVKKLKASGKAQKSNRSGAEITLVKKKQTENC